MDKLGLGMHLPLAAAAREKRHETFKAGRPRTTPAIPGSMDRVDLRFGKKATTGRPFGKALLWTCLALAPWAANTSRGHDGPHGPSPAPTTSSRPMPLNGVAPSRMPAAPAPADTKGATTQTGDGTLSANQIQWAKEMDQWYQRVEATVPGSAERAQEHANFANSYHFWINEARDGSRTYQYVVHSLWAHRMLDDIKAPAPSRVRFYDDQSMTLTNDLTRTGDRKRFDTETRIRAMSGLQDILADTLGKNPLLDDIPGQLYEPVTAILDANPNAQIQTNGHYLLNRVFNHLTEAQQKATFERSANRYFKTPVSETKFEAMRNMRWLYAVAPKLPQWEGFRTQVHESLKATEGSAERRAEQRFHLVLLSMLEDPNMAKTVGTYLSAEGHPQTQQTLAWILGRTPNRDNLNHLLGILNDTKHTPATQEMALYSLAEMKPVDEKQVLDTLKRFADQTLPEKTAATYDRVERTRYAAKAMTIKLQENLNEPDFYIKKFLEGDAAKQYKDLRKRFLIGEDRLSVQQLNAVDRTLIPIQPIIERIVNEGRRHFISDRYVSDYTNYKREFGVRGTSGRLNELSIAGYAHEWNGAVTVKNQISSQGHNTFTHEIWHQVDFHKLSRDPELLRRLERLYADAVAKRRTDDYGKTNRFEYLANGGSAMMAIYTHHFYHYLDAFPDVYNGSENATRRQLKDRDPELFRLIESQLNMGLAVSYLDTHLKLHLLKTLEPRTFDAFARAVDRTPARDTALA